MPAQPVEWVLVIYYGSSAHRATYGRLDGRDTKYTKDYIQLSKRAEFLNTVSSLFPVTEGEEVSVPLVYEWPTETAPGALVFNSSDRPHLKWETRLGAPRAWKMSLTPSEATAETMPGDPSHRDFRSAENELEQLAARGAGRPYLLAIKLRDEPRTLHLRAYLKGPKEDYEWAALSRTPGEIQALAEKTSRGSALAWSRFNSGGIAPSTDVEEALSSLAASEDWIPIVDELAAERGRALISYLRNPGYGLFFDPTRNHDGWSQPSPLSARTAASIDDILRTLEVRFPTTPQGDASAEALEADPDQVRAFREQIGRRSYEVADSTATVKTRGSAQKAFAEAVKTNYGYRCAITRSTTKEFLVASHIVPWSPILRNLRHPSRMFLGPFFAK